jgi:glyoxylase-like metal-dependent hydrolase (beta-lactamase superfamily II)
MTEKISENIWKVSAEGNVYFLDFKEKIIIDTSARANRTLIESSLNELVKLDKVDKVIFTHLHYDHSGNFDLFPNAKFFASEEEIEDFKKHPVGSVLDPMLARRINIELNAIKDLDGFEIIKTPGHTRGSICLWYKKEKIMFSGDTLFENGYGRIDLPTSVPDKMQESLNRVNAYKFKVLCPGHNY